MYRSPSGGGGLPFRPGDRDPPSDRAHQQADDDGGEGADRADEPRLAELDHGASRAAAVAAPGGKVTRFGNGGQAEPTGLESRLFALDQADGADVITPVLGPRGGRRPVRVGQQFAFDGDDVAGPKFGQPRVVLEPDLAAVGVILGH